MLLSPTFTCPSSQIRPLAIRTCAPRSAPIDKMAFDGQQQQAEQRARGPAGGAHEGPRPVPVRHLASPRQATQHGGAVITVSDSGIQCIELVLAGGKLLQQGGKIVRGCTHEKTLLI